MKTIFLITTLLSLQLKADIPVENPVETVDKEYQHQLTCKAVSQNQEYELLLKWKKIKAQDQLGRAPQFNEGFGFQIKNLSTLQIWSDNYEDFISEHTTINENDTELTLSGSFFMFKRLGTISKTSELAFVKQDSTYQLFILKMTASETFKNPIDYCNPPTRLCGSHSQHKPKVIKDLVFENSVCEYQKL